MSSTPAREIRLSTLLAEAGVQPVAPPGADPLIGGATLDSRRVAPGDLFFALRGYKTNGEVFVPQAIQRGARAVLAASPRPAGVGRNVAWIQVVEPRRAVGLLSREYHGRPDESLALVGVTGTNGKTTVAFLVESIARAAGRKAGRIGTAGHRFGDVETPAAHTTPEAPDFYRMLAEMRDEAVDLVVTEVSSHALALERVAGAHFSAAAFLNLTRDHLDFHDDMESYFDSKARLFESLGPRQRAVLPADSEFGRRMAERTRGLVLTFGRSAEADVRLRDEHCSIDGSSAILDTPTGALPVRTPLAGRFNLDNVAAAAACALSLGMPPDSITSGVVALSEVPGRMQRIRRGQSFSVLVDYAHTDAALSHLLAAVRELTTGRITVVFGCGGDRDRGKRFEMGRAATAADEIVVTSDNPRGEDPQAIIDQVLTGVAAVDGAAARTRVVIDRARAIASAIDAARPGDVVVLAGKGHETTQTIQGEVRPFDDRVEAIRALAERGFDRGDRA